MMHRPCVLLESEALVYAQHGVQFRQQGGLSGAQSFEIGFGKKRNGIRPREREIREQADNILKKMRA